MEADFPDRSLGVCIYGWSYLTWSLADELLQLEVRLFRLSATLKPCVRRSPGDDPPTEKLALLAHGTCPQSSICRTCVHSNHRSLVCTRTAFSAKKEGGGAFQHLIRFQKTKCGENKTTQTFARH